VFCMAAPTAPTLGRVGTRPPRHLLDTSPCSDGCERRSTCVSRQGVEASRFRHDPSVVPSAQPCRNPSAPVGCPFARLADRGHQDRGGLVDDGIAFISRGLGKQIQRLSSRSSTVSSALKPLRRVASGLSLATAASRSNSRPIAFIVAVDVALQAAADGVLEQRIEMDRRRSSCRASSSLKPKRLSPIRTGSRRDPRSNRSLGRVAARVLGTAHSSAPRSVPAPSRRS